MCVCVCECACLQVKLEEQKAAGVVGKAEQLLRQGKTTARAALEDAQAAARKKIREAKIEHADKEHKTEQYYAKQVAEAEQREHQAKEAAGTKGRAQERRDPPL